MSEPRATYNTGRITPVPIPPFLLLPSPEERLGRIRDQHRLLRVLVELAKRGAITDGEWALLDQCVDEIGTLLREVKS